MTSRIRYEVLPTRKAAMRADPSLLPWMVTRNGECIATCGRKRDAVQTATTAARVSWWERGQLAQVRIKGRDGKIQDERTYGADPRHIKG